MLKNFKLIFLFLSIGISIGLFLYILGINGPMYRSEVVKLPVNLQTPTEHEINFTVDRTENYMVEIHLKSIFPKDKLENILGNYSTSGGGLLNVNWEVTSNKTIIEKGSNSKFGYSPIWGAGYSGLAIGTINAEEGNTYTLHVSTQNTSTDWNQADPYVEIGLHPAKLESYLAFQILGIFIMSALGVITSIVLLLYFVGKRNKASNKQLKKDQ